MKHGAKVKRCSVEGCKNIVVKGGVCRRHGAKKEQRRCSSEGCTNHAKKGGVCMKHGAKQTRKRCSFEGCTNQSQRRGVCRRHGAYRSHDDESTAVTSCVGSEFDRTTLTRPNQRASTASTNQGSVPEEVAVRVVIANKHAEV